MRLLTNSPSHAEKGDGQRVSLLTGGALHWYQRTLLGHAQWIALLARVLACRLQRPEQEVRLIALAALLHDIGKIAIPSTILNKPGPLTEQEWAIMRCHPQIGYQMLADAGGIYAHIAPLVLAHHERWDGLGYPQRLVGEAIPLGARIVAVVDAYNAITEQRPYQQSRTKAEAEAEVRQCAGSCYDPVVVEILLQVLNGEKSTSVDDPA